MALPDGLVPRPPDGMRPGQIGVVMVGRVIIGDIAVTLVDLAIRRYITVDAAPATQQPGSAPQDWRLTPRRDVSAAASGNALLSYERTLIDALTHDEAESTTSALAPRMPRILDRTRRELLHDAAHRGWIHQLHHDQRTGEGDEAAAHVRAFQHHLRQFAAEQGEAALTGPLLPYAMHFGMVRSSDLPLVRFARDWVRTFASLPGWHQPAPVAPDPLSEPVPVDNGGFYGLMGYWPAM